METSATPVRDAESRGEHYNYFSLMMIDVYILYSGAEGGTPDTTELGKDLSSSIFPFTNLSHEERQQVYERLTSKSQEMMYKFQKLFTTTKKSLREEKVSVQELVSRLTCLGSLKPTFKDVGLSLLQHQLPILAKSESVDDVMSVVKDYCSFFSSHILEYIIGEFGTSKDKVNLAAYKKDFIEYAKCCCVVEPLEFGKTSEGVPNNIIYVLLDDSFDNCTLSHLTVLKSDLRKTLNISSCVPLRLCRINAG